MIKFIVFAGYRHCANGGAGDIYGYAETSEDASKIVDNALDERDWAQILELEDQTFCEFKGKRNK